MFSSDDNNAAGGGTKHQRRVDNTNHQHNSSNSNNPAVVRPYSGSLPSPGYEWCRRCHVPSRRLQKPVVAATHNMLADPCYRRRSTDGICEPARRYYRQQYAYMAFWTVLVFGVLPPGVTFGGDDGDDE